MLAWFSGSPGPAGILAQAVNADGSPAGSPQTMPGTTVMVGGPSLSRTPIVARPKNGGYYIVSGVGYPTASKVRIWRVGSSSTTLLDTVRSTPETAVATDSKGRAVGGLDGRRVRRRARDRRALEPRRDALRRAGRRGRGQEGPLHVLGRRQRGRGRRST